MLSMSRATFELPPIQPGRWSLVLRDSWGEFEIGGALEVLPELPSGRTVNASEAPYSADPSGTADATEAIVKAAMDAGTGGTGFGSR